MNNDPGYSREWHQLSENDRTIIKKYQNAESVKVGALAEEFGLTVLLATLPTLISGEIRPDPKNKGKFIVKVNAHQHKNRQRFTIAHEIAHFLLHRDLIKEGVVESVLFRSSLSNAIEAQANRLAADILMPPELIEKYGIDTNITEDEELIHASSQMGVSLDALKIKLRLRD